MLPIDPSDGPGSFLPGDQPPSPPKAARWQTATPGTRMPRAAAHRYCAPSGDGERRHDHPSRRRRLGRHQRNGGPQPRRRYSSCEAIERALAAVVAEPRRLPGLLTELATTRLWVPLPDRRRPFTDGAAVRLPLIGYQDTEFVPCFTSVQRLTAWADLADAARPAGRGRRAGRCRTSWCPPRAWPDGCRPASGWRSTPTASPACRSIPECVPFLANLAEPWLGSATVPGGLIGQPPGEPAALLAESRATLGALPVVRQARPPGWRSPRRAPGLSSR